MRLPIYLTLLLSLPFFSSAQEALVKELQEKVQTYEQLLKEEQEKNAYLKEALDLRNVGVESKQGEVTIRVNKLIGNLEENTILVQGIVTYNGTGKQKLQFQSHELISPNGNQYEAHSSGLPNDQNRTFMVTDAEAGIPYGFSIQFKNVNEKIPTLALLRLKLYGSTGVRGVSFDFKGMDIQWDN